MAKSNSFLPHLCRSIADLSLLLLVSIGTQEPGIAQPSLQPQPALPSFNAEQEQPEGAELYTLGVGDRIQVDVFKVPDFSGDYQILIDGTLNLPQIGNVAVQGMTLKEAANAISAQYRDVLVYPSISVRLLSTGPMQVAISGEVNRPGSYTISGSDAGAQFPMLTQALQRAGGITQMADLRQVEVRRPQQSGDDQIIRVNLWEFLQTGNLRQDIALRNGDSIFIPTVNSTDLAESVQLASASFAADRSQPLNIAVVGEVYRPGPYTVAASARTGAAGETGQTSSEANRPPTITRAIQVAGGIKPQADIHQIQVHRVARNGSEQIINIDLWQLLQTGDLNQDLILQDRDTVVIPAATTISPAESTQIATASFSPDTIRVNVVGEVKQPGVVQIPPSTPLNQALLAAGGFNTRARQGSVDLIRLNPDGTVTQRKVSIDFATGINEATNPALRNDDVIVVHRSGLTAISDGLGSVVSPINSFLSIFSLFRIFGP